MKERWMKDKKFRPRIIIAAVLFLVLLGAAVYTVAIKPRLSKETFVYKEEAVERGDLVLGIMESGSLSFLESSIDYNLELEVEDDEEEDDEESSEEEEVIHYLEIEEVYVVSGQRMKKGDALFRFTKESVKAVRRNLKTDLSEAEIAFSEAQTDYNISKLSAQSTYDSSVKTGDRASADYQASLQKSEAVITGLEGKIQLLELEIKNAQEKLADEDFLNSITEADYALRGAKETYEETDLHNTTAYLSNLTAYQQAEETFENLKAERKGYEDTIAENQAEILQLQKDIEDAKVSQVLENREAENTYQCAKLQGELAEEVYQYSTASLEDTVAQAEMEYKEWKTRMEAFEAFVGEDNTIYAAEDGLVTSVAYEAGDNLVSVGSMLTYATEKHYTVSIDVSEEDIAAVTVGDQVDIVFTAYPDQTWKGTISSITTTATTEFATTISYPVTIQVEGDTSLLYGGMTADVTFVTESVTDVLYVSKKAVFEENGKQYVYRKTASGDRQKVQVETGFTDMTGIEIKSGLSENDTVYIKSVMSVQEENKEDTSEKINNGESAGNAQQEAFPGGDSSGENFPDGGSMPDFGGDFPGGGGMPDFGGDFPGGGSMPDFGDSFPGNMGGGR